MLLGGQMLGSFKIIRPLGAGGFGAVFLAEDTRLGKMVALKVPHKQGQEADEMLKEPRLMASLNHPNIVQVFTVDNAGDIFFMVMEYVEGQSLHDRITEKGTLSEDEAIGFALQILRALDYAHDRNILHRDVRPSNVLITLDDHAKLADFGTSRLLETGRQAATRVGSPPYMAPEHFEARAVFASDIYSVGVMLYEMVTGQLPVLDVNPAKIYEKIMQGKITPVNLKNSAVSREFGAVVEKCMATKVSDRYQIATAVIQELEKIRERNRQPPAVRAMTEARERIDAATYNVPLTQARRTPPEAPRIHANVTSRQVCWNCHKPVPPRAAKCPACGEKQ